MYVRRKASLVLIMKRFKAYPPKFRLAAGMSLLLSLLQHGRRFNPIESQPHGTAPHTKTADARDYNEAHFVVLYYNFRSLAFLGLLGFLVRQLGNLCQNPKTPQSGAASFRSSCVVIRV